MINNTEFVLLLLLEEHQGCNGYTLKQVVEERGYGAWAGVSSSSIYVTLKKLQKRDLVNSYSDANKSSKGPTGVLFEPNKKGIQALKDAVIDGLSSEKDSSPRYNIALSGIELITNEEAVNCFTSRLEKLCEKVEILRKMASTQGMPLSANLLYSRIISNLDAEIIWMEKTISTIKT